MFRATTATRSRPTATVCWCNAVTVERVEESAAQGNETVACIGRDTRAGTGCGGCKSRIADVLARHAAATAGGVNRPTGTPTSGQATRSTAADRPARLIVGSATGSPTAMPEPAASVAHSTRAPARTGTSRASSARFTAMSMRP